MDERTNEDVVAPENPNDQAITLRRPDIPVTLAELAALKSEALEIIEARIQILQTLRKAAIRATSPEDWVLYRDEVTGLTVSYLQDCGADRVRDLYGIEIFNLGPMQKIEKGTVFSYFISGSGRCHLTRQVVEAVEGGRSSGDDFCRGKEGLQLELDVRKAARANLDGNITRELAGLKSVPVQELEEAWKGTTKTVDRCRKGRGFGTRAEREGATVEDGSGIPPDQRPTCPNCDGHMKFIPAGTTKATATKAARNYPAFWACLDRKCGGSINFKDSQESRKQPATPPAPAAKEVSDDDIPF